VFIFKGNQATTCNNQPNPPCYRPTTGSAQNQLVAGGSEVAQAQELAVSAQPGKPSSTTITWQWGIGNNWADIGEGLRTKFLIVMGYNKHRTRHRVIACDNRGVGRTDKPNIPYSIAIISMEFLKGQEEQ
jgi:pimeloyl-ACP methyl ester carboxylesterase